MKLIPRQEITSCAKCPFLRCRLHKKYECFISTAKIGGVEGIQGIDKDCPLEDVPEPKESNYTDKPVQPCPDCGGDGLRTNRIIPKHENKCTTCHGTCKNVLVSTNDLSTYEADCPTCKRTTSCTGNPESCKSKEPQVENPDNCAIHCVLLREVDGVLDRFNATKGNENELCLFCHSKKYDTDGIIHIRGCIIRKLREGYEAGRKDKLGG
jgi:hypothetical protein